MNGRTSSYYRARLDTFRYFLHEEMPGHPVYDLNGWKFVSNLARNMIRMLIAHGEKMGSVPVRDWFVTVDPIGMSSVLLVQHWGEGGWRDGLPASTPYAFEEGKLVALDVREVSRKAV